MYIYYTYLITYMYKNICIYIYTCFSLYIDIDM